jgi:hypothetical protein
MPDECERCPVCRRQVKEEEAATMIDTKLGLTLVIHEKDCLVSLLSKMPTGTVEVMERPKHLN